MVVHHEEVRQTITDEGNSGGTMGSRGSQQKSAEDEPVLKAAMASATNAITQDLQDEELDPQDIA